MLGFQYPVRPSIPVPNGFDEYHPPESTADSFWTAPTQPQTQPDDTSDTQEDSQSDSKNIYDDLWGRLLPCNPASEPFDLKNDKPSYTMGRNTNNDIVVPSYRTSGRHCEIKLIHEQDGAITVNVSDYSTNGTYINGQKIGKGKHMRMVHGDEISLGLPGNSLDVDDLRFMFRRSCAPITTGGGLFSQYQLGDVLGKGSFATVRKVYSKLNSESYACKIISKSRFAHNPKNKEMFDRELAILQTLRHHNITRLIEYFEDESSIFIVMELVGGGDMLDWIIKHGPVPENVAQRWAAQMVDGIGYVHRKNITHRDLKPENILLSMDGNIKLADFGLAKAVDNGTFLKTMCGTPSYLAPEVVLRGEQDSYDFKVDCWSLGVIIWSMLTNVACFNEDESIPLQQRMATREVDWDLLQRMHVSDDCLDFVRKLIVNNPHNRMSITEARQHPWIRHIENLPPEGFIGSQESQASFAYINDREHTASPHLSLTTPVETDYRGFGAPRNDNYTMTSDGSSVQQSMRMTPSVSDTPSPKSWEECSQDLGRLNLETPAEKGSNVMSIDGDESFTSSSVANGEKDGSWNVIPSNGRAVKPVPKSRKASAEQQQQQSKKQPLPPPDEERSATPRPRHVSNGNGQTVTRPTGTKRKTMDSAMDQDSSDLSSPPSDNDDDDDEGYGGKSLASSKETVKAGKTRGATGKGRNADVVAATGATGSGSRTSNRLKEKLSATNATTSTTPSTTTRRRSGPKRGYRAPSESDNDMEEDTPRGKKNGGGGAKGPSAPSTSAAATSSRPRRAAKPAPAKAPRRM
ncbi:hypothetical protein FRC03_006253 [Tulasnella sp. 419]|nr:hypothetical protein FRC03_006253 [Tulasnella sp. 419]